MGLFAVDEQFLEDAHIDLLLWFGSLAERVEIGRPEHTVLLRVAVGVGDQRHKRTGPCPLVALLRIGHRGQFTQGQGGGIDADDTGELPDEPPA